MQFLGTSLNPVYPVKKIRQANRQKTAKSKPVTGNCEPVKIFFHFPTNF
jgi:hypothetical protein